MALVEVYGVLLESLGVCPGVALVEVYGVLLEAGVLLDVEQVLGVLNEAGVLDDLLYIGVSVDGFLNTPELEVDLFPLLIE